jgi:hypothetical protein
VERADAEPVRLADDRLPALTDVDASGNAVAVLGRLGEARAETNRALDAVPASAMSRPAVWVHHEVDVRFRLHRFAAHLVEHAIQCEKILHALGWGATEGRRIARRISALLGEIEGLGATAEARELEDRLAERHASLGAPAGA